MCRGVTGTSTETCTATLVFQLVTVGAMRLGGLGRRCLPSGRVRLVPGSAGRGLLLGGRCRSARRSDQCLSSSGPRPEPGARARPAVADVPAREPATWAHDRATDVPSRDFRGRQRRTGQPRLAPQSAGGRTCQQAGCDELGHTRAVRPGSRFTGDLGRDDRVEGFRSDEVHRSCAGAQANEQVGSVTGMSGLVR